MGESARPRSAIAAVVAVVFGFVAAAQTPPPAPQGPQISPVFRGGIDLVQLDVSVLDRNRHPVRGLQPADFTILEDGKPQTIAAFSAVDLPDPPANGSAWVRDVAPDVRSNAPVDHRLVVIVIDDAALELDMRAVASVKRIAKDVIDRLGPADLASVVFTLDNRQAQDFTADHVRLHAAVDKVSASFRGMGGTGDELYLIYSANVVDEAIRYLATVPDRRKAIIYIGQGVPLDLGTLAAPAAPVPLGQPTSNQGWQLKVFATMKEALTEARKANITVYTVDACGLRVRELRVPPPPLTCQPGEEVDYLQTLAEGTGGRAVINTNDFDPGLTEIFEENGSYYLLGYQPASGAADGRFHRIEVRVNRPGLEVRTRNGYDAEKPVKTVKPQAAAPLTQAMSGILPVPDIALQAVAVPFAAPGGKDAAVATLLGIHQTDLASADTRVVETLDLQMSVFTPEGKLQRSQRQTARVVVRAGTSGDIQYEVFSRMDLKPGRYNVRLSAHSGRQNKNGSVYVDVEVPDFGKAPLALSGLVLSAVPSPAAAGREAIAAFMPVAPTTRREFSHADQVAAFVRVYQGGKGTPGAVSLSARVESSDGREVFHGTYGLTGDQFAAGRFVDQQVALPIATLPAGMYLLSTEAKLNNVSVQRQVRFRVF